MQAIIGFSIYGSFHQTQIPNSISFFTWLGGKILSRPPEFFLKQFKRELRTLEEYTSNNRRAVLNNGGFYFLSEMWLNIFYKGFLELTIFRAVMAWRHRRSVIKHASWGGEWHGVPLRGHRFRCSCWGCGCRIDWRRTRRSEPRCASLGC